MYFKIDQLQSITIFYQIALNKFLKQGQEHVSAPSLCISTALHRREW